MAFEGIQQRDRENSGCQQALRAILHSLQRFTEQLKVTDGTVRFVIDWDSLNCQPDVKPALLYNLLLQHISDTQPLLDKLQSLEKEESVQNNSLSTAVGTICAEKADHKSKDLATAEKVTPESLSKDITSHNSGDLDPSIIQIKAKKAEIDRRILAFMERKQAEINENNVREFCNVIDCNQENSCARTDAVFTPYPGFKSHIKVSRVVNTYGPQTKNDSTRSSRLRMNPLQRGCGNQAVEERLQNIECHLRLQTDLLEQCILKSSFMQSDQDYQTLLLKGMSSKKGSYDKVQNEGITCVCIPPSSEHLKQGGPVPKDIYQRIKKLEDKILELEGISPEYFHSLDVSKKRKMAQSAENYSLAEIDQKINKLKQSLLRKSRILPEAD